MSTIAEQTLVIFGKKVRYLTNKHLDYTAFKTRISMEFIPNNDFKLPFKFFIESIVISCTLVNENYCKHHSISVPDTELYSIEVWIRYDNESLKDNYICLPNHFIQTTAVAKYTRSIYLSLSEIISIDLMELIEGMFKADCELERKQEDQRILAEADIPLTELY